MPHMMLNGCNTYFEEHGTGQNTIIFLHDLFFSHRMFNNQMIALRDRFRCILLDLRGHGASRVSSGGYSAVAQAKDIAQFIEVRRYGPCHLVGCGFGGSVALQAAIRFPNVVSSVSLINTVLDLAPEIDARFLKSKSLQLKLFGPRFIAGHLLRRSFSSNFLKNPDYKDQVLHWKREFLKLDRRETARAIAAYLMRLPLSDALYQLTVPALIVGCNSSTAAPLENMKRTQNLIKRSSALTLKGAAQAANIEAAGEINPVLLEFLCGVKR